MAEKKSTVKKMKEGLQAAAIATAGFYASYAGAAVTGTQPAAQAQEQELEETRNVWSDEAEYAAQTKFLKVVFAAYDGGEAPLHSFYKAVADAYARCREDLGKLFSGTFDEKVTSIVLEADHVELTLTYKPADDSKHADFERVELVYRVAATKTVFRKGLQPDVKVIAWRGYDAATKRWSDLAVPKKMQPTRKKTVKLPQDCAYPRWNPRGVRYGFIKRSRLIR